MKTISVIIPTYNEAPRIGAVLEVLCSMGLWKEVIVVDDGSTDGTQEVVAAYPVRYLSLGKNLGKAAALDYGVKASTSDYLFFCDADLTDLTPAHVLSIVEPVLKGTSDLSVGTALNHQSFVYRTLSGQRAFPRSLWERMPNFYKKGYRVEIGLYKTARGLGKESAYHFQDYDHVKKEEKRGYLRGWLAKITMFVQVILAYLLYPFVCALRVLGTVRQEILKIGVGIFPLFFSFLFFFMSTSMGYKVLMALFLQERRMEVQEAFLDFTHLLIRHYEVEFYLILGSVFLAVAAPFIVVQIFKIRRRLTELSYSLSKL